MGFDDAVKRSQGPRNRHLRPEAGPAWGSATPTRPTAEGGARGADLESLVSAESTGHGGSARNGADGSEVGNHALKGQLHLSLTQTYNEGKTDPGPLTEPPKTALTRL